MHTHWAEQQSVSSSKTAQATTRGQAGAQTFLAGVAALVAGLAAAFLVVVFLAAGALAPVTGAFLAAFFTPVVFLATVFLAPVAAFLVAVVFLAAGFFAAGREALKVSICCWANRLATHQRARVF